MRLLMCLGLLVCLCGCQKVAFYVNDQAVMVSELERSADLSQTTVDDPQHLKKLINAKLMQQAAQAQGLDISPETIDRQIAAARAQAGGHEALRTRLVAQGMSMRDYRRDSKDRLLVLAFADALTADIQVTEAELKAYYEANLSQLKSPAAWGAEVLFYTSREAAEAARAALIEGQPLAELKRQAAPDSGWQRLSESDTSPGSQQLLALSRATEFGQPSEVLALTTEPARYALTVPEHYYLPQAPRFEDVRLQLQAQLEQRLGQARLAEALEALQQAASLRAAAFKLPAHVF